jgi:hypothetical protein
MASLTDDEWAFKRAVLKAIRTARTRNDALELLDEVGLASDVGLGIVRRIFPQASGGDAVVAGAGPVTVFEALRALQAAEPLLRALAVDEPANAFSPDQIADALRRVREAILALTNDAV